MQNPWTGVIAGNFEKNPKGYQNSLLWTWSEQSFTPKRDNVLNILKVTTIPLMKSF